MTHLKITLTEKEVEFLERVLRLDWTTNENLTKKEQASEKRLRDRIQLKLNIYFNK